MATKSKSPSPSSSTSEEPKQVYKAPPIMGRMDNDHNLIDPLGTPLCMDVWSAKYRYQSEDWLGMAARVTDGVYAKDDISDGSWIKATYNAIRDRLWMPAGRILAGAGTPKRVTLLNCFVNSTIEDSMESITQGLSNIMLTQQQGGGIGTDFSLLRPRGALLERTGSEASGPGPFIDVWDSACTTIRSAGDRRGAMMGTLHCSNPFLPEFITAKQKPGKWTNFNVSVLISDAFMGAVEEDADWYLHHPAKPAFERPPELAALDFQDDEIDDGRLQYVYSVHKARDLWDDILRSTYEYAEPGVIFIDRVNDLNNLQPWETISCTNPCGEQPLPPHGCCDLGAANLARMVKKPFSPDAAFDWELLVDIISIGVRFLDNVIDVTNYPLEEQQAEEFAKRRIGIGISGLADAIAMLGMRYGSAQSIEFTELVMKTIAFSAYRESVELAKQKGMAPIFLGDGAAEQASNLDALWSRPFIQKLPADLRQDILKYGLRNGVLLTIAPTGTTSIAYGNISSGLEPVFAHSMRRKVRQQNDDLWLAYDEVAYGARLWMALNPGSTLEDLPPHMNVCADVRVYEHIRIQEVCQKWVDASISKTINLPTEISYEDFKAVYTLAYEGGCKGCTTYRPSGVRGSILEVGGSVEQKSDTVSEGATTPTQPTVIERPETITGTTSKIRWPGLSSSLYLTVNSVDGKPYEVFLNSKDQKSLEWTMTTTILMSMALRNGTSLEQIAREFQGVSALEGGWAPGPSGKPQYWPSLIAYVGFKLEEIASLAPDALSMSSAAEVHLSKTSDQNDQHDQTEAAMPKMDQCPSCRQFTVTNLSGCKVCTNCGESKCS